MASYSRDLTLVIVAKDEEDARRFDVSYLSAAECVFIINYSKTPLSAIGNRWLEWSRTGLFGLVHADTYFGPGAIEAMAEAAAGGAVCGVVGFNPDNTQDQRYVWADKNPGPVSTLDSASLFQRRDLGLKYDESRFTFHLHNEDLCLQASARGIPVIVPAADATHRSAERNGPSWQQEYWTYYEIFRTKWAGVRYGVT